MFGALRLRRHGLEEDDRAFYNAHFCLGCHALREFGGLPASLMVNYDQTFLLLIYAGLEQSGESRRLPCTAVPFRRVQVQPLSPESRARVAALTVALVDAKLRDDVQDDRSLAMRAARRVYAGTADKARRVLQERGFDWQLMADLGARQSLAEAAPNPTLDTLAAPTADLMAEVFGWAGQCQPPLRALGTALGRYLYLWDAVTDVEEDRRKGRFNALLACFGEAWPRAEVRSFLERELRDLQSALRQLPLDETRMRLVMHLVKSMRNRLHSRLPSPAPLLVRRLRYQAGDCDCSGCDCGGADSCCSGCDASGCCNSADCGNCCSGCDNCSCGDCDSPCSSTNTKGKPKKGEPPSADAAEPPAAEEVAPE